MQEFDKENIGDYSNWPTYRKKPLTHMKRMKEPFIVKTREGPLRCDDGFLAIDSKGNPYPIAADEQAAIYELVGTVYANQLSTNH